MRVGHSTKTIQLEIDAKKKNGRLVLTKAALARLLMDGFVYSLNR